MIKNKRKSAIHELHENVLLFKLYTYIYLNYISYNIL